MVRVAMKNRVSKNKKFVKRGAKQLNECHEDEIYNVNCTHHHSVSEQLDHSFDTLSFSELSTSKLSLADNKHNEAFVTLHVKFPSFPGRVVWVNTVLLVDKIFVKNQVST